MKAIYLSLGFALCTLFASAQNEDAAGSLLLAPTSMIYYTNSSFPTSQCGNTTYNLGASTSPQTPAGGAGSMNNDVWFHFVAAAEVAKIKVCNPSNFNVNLELWNATATGSPISFSNTNGVGMKEVICANGLVVGNTYKVRVGRSDGAGTGTFNIIYEHLAVSIRTNYYPGPSPATCYNFTAFFKRTLIDFSIGLGQTRWKFVDAQGNIYGPYLSDGNQSNFSIFNGICENVGSVVAYVEVQADDPDCGNIWWGYSIGRTLNICGIACPTINVGTSTCGSSYCNIFSTLFECSFVGQGLQYQYRFVTDNGQTEFITPWSTSSSFNTSALPYSNYFRYGKVYQVYVRAKRCVNNPNWCGPCSFTTCGMPYANITNTNEQSGLPNYCRWRDKQGPFMFVNGISGMDQYRYRLMPVDPCASNPFLPTGGAITTGWGNSNSFNAFAPSAYNFPLGQVYILQAQCRVLPATFTNTSGQTITIPGQQSDWGWPCFVGFRNSSSPAPGSPIDCCSFPTPASGMLPEEFLGENRWTEFYEWENEVEPFVTEGTIMLASQQGRELTIQTSESLLHGNALCELYNIHGQLIHSSSIAAIHENEVVTIATREELPGGIYLLTISTPQGRVSLKFLQAR
jgi:hypothetical protein